MNRRHFLAGSIGTLTAVTGVTGRTYGRSYFGWGASAFAPPTEAVPWETAIDGQVRAVDDETIRVRLEPRRRIRAPVVVSVRERTYPDGDAGAVVHSRPAHLGEPGSARSLALPLPDELRSASGSWFYEVYVQRRPRDDAAADRMRFLCESKPYRMRDSRRKTAVARPREYRVRPAPAAPGFSRDRSESAFALRYEWSDGRGDGGERRSVGHRIRRSAYDAARGHRRGHVRTYEETLEHPDVAALARAIESEVSRSGSPPGDAPHSTDARTHFLALVRFVQHLPYGHDQDVLEKFDYNRTVEETLVDGMGDCKDKTNLLAGLLERSRFACNTAFICQPSHIFLGVSPADVPDSLEPREKAISVGGNEYVPIETTGPEPIGAYRDADPITAAYDGEWVYVDPTAVWPIAKSVADGLVTVYA